MAPKKKGEGKKKKKKKTEIQAATKAIEEVVTETQEFYHIQIRDLENRLDRYKEKWDEFSQQDKVFQEEFNQLAHNKKEVVSFLKRTLNQRVDEIADLNSQLQGLQISKEMEKDAFEARLAQVRHEFQETKDQLTMENIMLGGKLAALEEFQFQKADLLAKFSLLEDQLKKQRDDYKSYVCHMERKALMDKERLRKDIIHRINTVAAEFRRFSSSQMAETTKRAIRENVTVALGLAKINSGNLEQIKENNVLKESKEELCKQLALLERDEKTMAKNSLTHIKVIQLLSEKCQEQQHAEIEADQLQIILSQAEIAFQQVEEDNKELKNKIKSLRLQLNSQKTEGKRLRRELEKERDNRQSLEVLLTKATCHLQDLLKAHPEKTEACKIDILFQLGRKEMLQQLLDMLNEAVVVGPHIPEFVPPPINSPSIQSLMTTEESFKQPEPLPLLQQLANIQPYRIGDLGLVPHPPSTTEDGQDAATFRNLRSVKAFSNPEIPRPQILREIKQVSMPAFHLYPSVEGQQE
ncbi:cilia- and flagella-associated protein 157-like [Phascolarctos cinereus]|uniref:Cilia- and flagella-associated protein 157 n=1 Tax=Phascolarctos cinereus TaxID=38626 RepID=A0A6P5IJ02_PHACI|nr:cilia- and flagella-associated protein 157-like isoform X1 [Phascolarctos cinereus]